MCIFLFKLIHNCYLHFDHPVEEWAAAVRVIASPQQRVRVPRHPIIDGTVHAATHHPRPANWKLLVTSGNGGSITSNERNTTHTKDDTCVQRVCHHSFSGPIGMAIHYFGVVDGRASPSPQHCFA